MDKHGVPRLVCFDVLVLYQAGFQEPRDNGASALKLARGSWVPHTFLGTPRAMQKETFPSFATMWKGFRNPKDPSSLLTWLGTPFATRLKALWDDILMAESKGLVQTSPSMNCLHHLPHPSSFSLPCPWGCDGSLSPSSFLGPLASPGDLPLPLRQSPHEHDPVKFPQVDLCLLLREPSL